MIQKMLNRINLDGLGITASLACAIHCAVLPLLFNSFPLLGVNIINNHAFEYFMIALAFVIGVTALRHGFKKHHHKPAPFVLLSIGFGFLIVKEILSVHQTWLVIPAVIFIVSAHFYNYRLCRKANHCHANDCNH